MNNLELLLTQTKSWDGDSDKHSLTLFSLVVSLNAKNVLELGARNGNTTIPLLTAINETGGKLTSVDIDVNSKNKCEEQVSRYISNKDLKNWSFFTMDAIEFLEFSVIGDNCYDIIYVDDWHSYDHVKKEFELIDKLITPKSLVLVHDTMYANYEPHYHTDIACKTGQWANGGPYRAIAELDQNFWEFSTIPVNNGLTIVRKKYSKLYNIGG